MSDVRDSDTISLDEMSEWIRQVWETFPPSMDQQSIQRLYEINQPMKDDRTDSDTIPDADRSDEEATDWFEYFPDEPAPPGARPERVADHACIETTHGRFCPECKCYWRDLLAEDSRACFSRHNDRTRRELQREREWLWSTIEDAALGGTG